MPSLFMTAPRIVFGAGAIVEIGRETIPLGKRPLLVTGRSALRSSGALSRIRDSLDSEGASPVLFDKVPPEPDLETVEAGREVLRSEGADCVVAAGGGSALDVGKAVAALADCPQPISAYQQGAAPENRGVSCLAVPTTSGTGAEVTRNSVITDRAANRKQSIRGDSFIPATVIVDPELTITVPPDVTAQSGMDALTQAIEAFTSIHATPITDALALKAAELMLQALPAAVADGQDLSARTDCSWGSLLAGIALNNARLGAVHGIAHPLGCRYHMPHGLCCAVLLPAVLEININAGAAEDKYSTLSHVAGEPILERVRQLLTELKLPSDFKDRGIARSDFDAVAAESMPSGSLKANPKKFTQEDVKDVLEAVC